MIKYNIKTGDKALNMRLREYRELYKSLLKGMYCGKHKRDTFISWEKSEDGYYDNVVIDACCSEFEQRIKEKLDIGA